MRSFPLAREAGELPRSQANFFRNREIAIFRTKAEVFAKIRSPDGVVEIMAAGPDEENLRGGAGITSRTREVASYRSKRPQWHSRNPEQNAVGVHCVYQGIHH